jgi:two-component system cell cycle response regulator
MQPDLILMDIYLPDITGDEITARLKANPATRDIPVIITTALLERTAKNRALHAVPQKFWRSRLAYPQCERFWTDI